MSLRSATEKALILADATERATRAANNFPELGTAPALPGGGGPGIGATALREALAPLIAGIGVVRDLVDVPAGGVELAERMFTA